MVHDSSSNAHQTHWALFGWKRKKKPPVTCIGIKLPQTKLWGICHRSSTRIRKGEKNWKQQKWFEGRNYTKPCYWKCVDTFNSAATTFNKTASLCWLNKRDSGGFCFYIQCFVFKENFCFQHFFYILPGWQMNDDDNKNSSFGSHALIVQVKSCTFISFDAFITFVAFRYVWSLLLCNSIISLHTPHFD